MDVFCDMVRTDSVSLYMSDNRRMSEARGGAIRVNSYGAKLWRGSVTIPKTGLGRHRSEVAFLHQIQQADYTFLMHSPEFAFPASDPTGAVVSGWSAKFRGATTAQAAQVVIDGIPAGFKFTAGDRLSYSFGLAPVRYFLHEITADSADNEADGSRILQVRSFVPAGIPDNTDVNFVRPSCEVLAVPSSVSIPGQGLSTRGGASFDVVQVVR